MGTCYYRCARIPGAFTAAAFSGETPVLADWDITVADGRVSGLKLHDPTVDAPPDAKVIELGGRIVFPGFVDAHVHLDKAFTWDRAPNHRGEFWDAIELLSNDRKHWDEADLYRRASFALRCAAAHGTVAMRTHVDCSPDFGHVSHAVMDQLRKEWLGRIELQTVSLCSLDQYSGPGGELIADQTLAYPDALLGGMPQMNADLDQQLDRFFAMAAERGVGVDLHVDENGDPDAECLRHVAEAVLRNEFPHPVTCGHVCSLAMQTAERAASTIDLVKAAGIQIISLPLCNLYLQGRRGVDGKYETPRWRGVTLLHELIDAGVVTACASDNVRDAFYAWGDFDLLEVFIQSVRIAHLDTKLNAAAGMVTTAPTRIMGLEDRFGSLKIGSDARLVCFPATSFNELISRPAQARELLGFADSTALSPDYTDLL